MKRRLTQAIGAGLVFAMFGGAWAAFSLYALGRRDFILAIPVGITMLLTLGLTKLQRKIEALPDERLPLMVADRDARSRKIFTAVNIAQLIAIVAAVQAWTMLRKPEYAAPTVAVIVGLHFLALARPMEQPLYRITGALLIVLSLGTAVAVPSHAMWPVVVGLGSAVILWTCYAVRLREVLSSL
jgi:hypothetical protein